MPRWLCNEHAWELGNNCIRAPDGDVIGYSTREECESECIFGIGMVGIYDRIIDSGIKFPFMDAIKPFIEESRAKEMGPNRTAWINFNANNSQSIVFGSLLTQKYLAKFLVAASTNHAGDYMSTLINTGPGDGEKLVAYAATLPERTPLEKTMKARVRKSGEEIIKIHKRPNHYYYRPHLPAEVRVLRPDAPIQMGDPNDYATSETTARAAYKLLYAGVPFVITSMLQIDGMGGHTNVVVIDPAAKRAFYVEPHVVSHWAPSMDRIMFGLFKNIFERLGLDYVSTVRATCFASMQGVIHNDPGACSSWSMMMTETILLNPDKTEHEILKLFIDLRNIAQVVLLWYAYYVYTSPKYQSFIDEYKRDKWRQARDNQETFDWRRERGMTKTDPSSARHRLLAAMERRDTDAWYGYSSGGASTSPHNPETMVNAVIDDDLSKLRALIRQTNFGAFVVLSKFMAVLDEVAPA